MSPLLAPGSVITVTGREGEVPETVGVGWMPERGEELHRRVVELDHRQHLGCHVLRRGVLVPLDLVQIHEGQTGQELVPDEGEELVQALERFCGDAVAVDEEDALRLAAWPGRLDV